MKSRNTLFWIFFSLFFIQQASLVVAAPEHASMPSEMASHQMMTHSMGDDANNTSDMLTSNSCCVTDCHCDATGCHSPIIFSDTSKQGMDTFIERPRSTYLFAFIQAQTSPLFRPPIFI
jgi:hypothetical protein